MPVVISHQFKIKQTGIPAIKSDDFGFKPTFIRLYKEVLEMVIFAQPVLVLMVKPKIAR